MASPEICYGAAVRRAAVVGASIAVGAMRWLARARLPDDYDSIGFVRALGHFDLAQLQPHFPGYPVYVALGKAALAVGLSPLGAATLVSSLAAAVTAAALFRLGARLAETATGGWAALALYAGAWLPWMLGGAALSDATATAFVALAFAALTVDGALGAALAGAAMALALGTRASYWPLALSFAIVAARRPHRRAALAGALAGLAAWALPFVAVVGPRALVALGRTHLVGHFTTWGGSIATQPNLPLRMWAFARALVYDGLFAHGLALAAATAIVLLAARPRALRLALLVGGPYALWALLAQNVVEQPRHLLPLVSFTCVGLGAALARRPLAAGAIALLALVPSLPLAVARVRVEPAAAQAARWTAANFPRENAVVVFGARSIRFFDELAPSILRRTRTWLSEVDVDLERLDVLPPRILITSEVDIDEARAARVDGGPTFCRDRRIDRGQPCLTLRDYRIR
jgi:hypothetical protein